MRALDDTVLAYTSDILARMHRFLEELLKVYNHKIALSSYYTTVSLVYFISNVHLK